MKESWFKKLCEDIVTVCGNEQITWPDYNEICWKKIHFSRWDLPDIKGAFFFDIWYDFEMHQLLLRSYALNYKNEQVQMTESYQTMYHFMEHGSFQPMIWRFVRECVRRII